MIAVALRAVTDTKIIVTSTATPLYTLMDTASSMTKPPAQKFYDGKFADSIMIRPHANIRYLINADPDNDHGDPLVGGAKYYIPRIELFGMRLVSEGEDVTVDVIPYRAEQGESPVAIANTVTTTTGEELIGKQNSINEALLKLLTDNKKQTEYLLTLIGGDSYRLSDDDVNSEDSI